MDRFEAIRVFLRVAELESFTRAAEEMNIPKATVSNSIQQLETQVGAQLLHRTTRRVRLTQDGTSFYQRGKDLLEDFDELESMFQQSPAHLGGRIRVDMTTGLAKNLVIPNLKSLLDQYPGIELEISSTDRRVDIIQEGFDCVIRAGAMSDSSLVARFLGEMRIVTCVSPGYIEEYGEPESLEQLPEHRLVHYVPVLGSKKEGWEYWDGSQYQSIEVPGAVTVNNVEAYSYACLAGLGMIQSPAVGVRKYLDGGAMVEVLKQYQAEPIPVYLVYPHRRNLSKRVRIFMEWLAELIKEYIEQSPDDARIKP
ncbi:LysR family transcriptional regulator [Hahella sp. CCB-MM4]|uniref:LysR family transcriptional regulator n=1 Tax=Hahella sp. (strain CCB-MM4) TaxID=1926491 RepID=UPI000B9A3F74|nr:LysR family transcriptional regulator [Hahella sp. CCB-MM4]OZG70772.1 LysR family transcriptional regulator [Hahella sp. CCB-MM4]